MVSLFPLPLAWLSQPPQSEVEFGLDTLIFDFPEAETNNVDQSSSLCYWTDRQPVRPKMTVTETKQSEVCHNFKPNTH